MDNKNYVKEWNQLKYQVVVDGAVLSEWATPILAETNLHMLPDDIRQKARIITATSDSKQFLLG